MRFEWAYHNGRLAPRQQDYKPTQSQCLHLETSKESINSQQRMVNSLKSWKFNQEPRLSNQKVGYNAENIIKSLPKIIPKKYLNSKSKP